MRNLAAKILDNEKKNVSFCNSETKVRQNRQSSRLRGSGRSRGTFSRSRSEGRYVVWLLVSCSRSLFSGIVTRCANTGFRCNEPAYTCVRCMRACVRTLALRAYRPHGLHRSARTDSRTCPSISPALSMRLKPLRCPSSTRYNYPLQSNFAKSACTSH